MKQVPFIVRSIPLFLFALVFLAAPPARAQGVSVYFGAGAATDSSSNQQIDTFGDGNLFPTPKMTGTFGLFGGDFMISHGLGVNAEYAFRFNQGGYAGLNYRPAFYDFNGIWRPLPIVRKISPEVLAGIGGANLKFYFNQQFCDTFAGCSTSNTLLESSNHFQVHLGAGVRIYVKGGIFVRPAVDVHWVNNFFQFGSGWVPQYTVSIGYTAGLH